MKNVMEGPQKTKTDLAHDLATHFLIYDRKNSVSISVR